MRTDPSTIAQRIIEGDRRALARGITLVENSTKDARILVEALAPHGGRAWRIGLTGPPGVGKSTLVTRLARMFRSQGSERVGVLAVDPTSPFSGGALLGDRVRMTSLATDPGIFIRSMATRGAFGGLARAANDALDLLDAFGADPLLVETVGVGQSEVEIASLADTTVLVLSPESGDGVQAMKAGVMEIADVFAVNKADRKGAHRVVQDIQDALDLGHGRSSWRPPVVLTVGSSGEGLDELREAIAAHRAHQEAEGGFMERRRRAARHKIEDLVTGRVLELVRGLDRGERLVGLTAKVAGREVSAQAAAQELLGLLGLA